MASDSAKARYRDTKDPKERCIALGPLVRAFPDDRFGGNRDICMNVHSPYKVQRLETVEHVMEDVPLAKFSY